MAASATVVCTANTWVLAAEGVTSATIHRTSVSPNVYKTTYVANGFAAPSDDSHAVLMFSASKDEEIITAPQAIDVYVKAMGVNGLVEVHS